MAMIANALARAETARTPTAPARPPVQAKLRVGPVDDPLEREADRVADAVVSGQPIGMIGGAPSAAAQRKCAECDAEGRESVHRKASVASAPQAAAGQAAVVSGGVPLSPHQRAYFEPRFGRDFGQVRVHADAAAERSAREMNALAYTVGHDIAFGAGQFEPGTDVGRRLIAHELTHVAQGTGEAVRRQPAPGAQETAQPAGPSAAYRLELANPFSDVEAHASTYELLPAFIGGLSRRYNFDEKVGWRLFEWVGGGLGFMAGMTYSHEEGHGGEARRLGYDPVVTLDWPWSGSTCPVPLTGGRCVAPPGWTPDNRLIFGAAGMNQQSINASRMASRWALRKSISYQEAMAYLFAQTNMAAYAVRTFALSINANEDDVYSYVTNQGSLSVGQLMGLAAVADLLSGPAWAALIGQWNYLRHGERQVTIPTFKVGREMRATLPNFQLLLGRKGPLLGGRSTINVNGRFPVEVSIDASLDEPGIAVGGQLHAPVTRALTISPFGRFSYSQSEGAGGLLGVEARYQLAPWAGISATLSYRRDDILTQPEGAAEGLQGRAALTLEF